MHGLTAVIGVYLSLLPGWIDARGGTGVRYSQLDTSVDTRSYPSQSRSYYYTFYVRYFSPAGLYYATRGTKKQDVRICRNMEPFFGNETVLGSFPCPMLDDPRDFLYCCGVEEYEYCCRVTDTLNFKLGVALGLFAAVAVIVLVVVFVVLKIKRRNKVMQDTSDKQQRKLERGIPHYETRRSGGFVAEQSTDGYMIIVKFASNKKYFHKFVENVHEKYSNISWRRDQENHVTEGKIVMADDTWVSVAFNEDYEGRPAMVVSREKAAVFWMVTEFEDLIHNIPNESSAPAVFKIFKWRARAKAACKPIVTPAHAQSRSNLYEQEPEEDNHSSAKHEDTCNKYDDISKGYDDTSTCSQSQQSLQY